MFFFFSSQAFWDHFIEEKTETHSFHVRDVAPWRGQAYHGYESLTHRDMCRLVCPGTNEASLPPLTSCHGQSVSSSLAITEGEPLPPCQGAESLGPPILLLLSQPGSV